MNVLEVVKFFRAAEWEKEDVAELAFRLAVSWGARGRRLSHGVFATPAGVVLFYFSVSALGVLLVVGWCYTYFSGSGIALDGLVLFSAFAPSVLLSAVIVDVLFANLIFQIRVNRYGFGLSEFLGCLVYLFQPILIVIEIACINYLPLFSFFWVFGGCFGFSVIAITLFLGGPNFIGVITRKAWCKFRGLSSDKMKRYISLLKVVDDSNQLKVFDDVGCR